MLRTHTHTHTHRERESHTDAQTDVDERFTPATVVGVCKDAVNMPIILHHSHHSPYVLHLCTKFEVRRPSSSEDIVHLLREH